MARIDENRRRGELKRNLASPGESNRRNVLAGRGQVQDQTSPIVSEKALEQPTIKKAVTGGVSDIASTARSAVGGAQRVSDIIGARKFGRQFAEGAEIAGTAAGKIGKKALSIATGGVAGRRIGRKALSTLTGIGGDPGRVVSPAITPEEITRAGGTKRARARKATVKDTVKPGFVGPRELVGPRNLSAEDRKIIGIMKTQNPTATPIFEGGELLGFRGTPPKPEGGVKKPKTFSVLTGEGIRNIFERSGEIAERLTTPEALAKLKRGRRLTAGRRERRASLKQLDTSITDIASTIEKLNLTKGNETTISALQTQLDDIISERSKVAAGGAGGRGGPDTSTVEGFAAKLKDLGLSDDEVRTVSQRRFAGGGT